MNLFMKPYYLVLFLLILFFLLNSCGKNDNVIIGCTDPIALNYDPNAESDDESCIYSGCTDSTALNFNPIATIDDSSCIYTFLGCTDSTAINYNPLANVDDGSCIYPIYGCTDSLAINFSPLANIDDGSCVYAGCNDPLALNFDTLASFDDGSCVYCEDIASGIWNITPSCPVFTIPVTGQQINLNDRFDDSINVVCNYVDPNIYGEVYIDFGSNQTVASNLDEFGFLDVFYQSFLADFSNEGFGFIVINVSGNGQIISPNSGHIDLTYSFLLPFSSDSSFVTCPLNLSR